MKFDTVSLWGASIRAHAQRARPIGGEGRG